MPMKANAEDAMKSLVEGVWQQLKENKKDWEPRYADFSLDVEKGNMVKQVEKKLRTLSSRPKLSLYTSVSREPSEVSLRFGGQIVADIKEQAGIIKVTARDNVRSYFKKSPALPKNESLDSPKVDKFLSFFETAADKANVRNKKNLLIDSLLKEFRKDGGKDKVLRFIQPVLLRGMFFSMPVPFDKAGKYLKGNKQGYIDILARVEKGFESRLCIMQVSNHKGSQIGLMRQALIHATFIVALIRSKSCGAEWWDFFENHEVSNTAKSKEHLDIDVVTVMPAGKTNEFTGKISHKELNCTFNCKTLYFNEKNLLAGELKEFTGTYPAYLN